MWIYSRLNRWPSILTVHFEDSHHTRKKSDLCVRLHNVGYAMLEFLLILVIGLEARNDVIVVGTRSCAKQVPCKWPSSSIRRRWCINAVMNWRDGHPGAACSRNCDLDLPERDYTRRRCKKKKLKIKTERKPWLFSSIPWQLSFLCSRFLFSFFFFARERRPWRHPEECFSQVASSFLNFHFITKR